MRPAVRAVGAAVAFAGLTGDVLRSGPVTRADSAVLYRVVAVRRRGWLPPARAVTLLGSTPLGCGVLGVVLTVRRRPDAAVAGACVYLTRRLLSERAARARPPESVRRTRASGGSYPSRHTTTAAVGARLIADTLAPRRPWARRLGRGVVACVATSRIVLGVHWPSDVVGGWLFADACLDAVEVVIRRPKRIGLHARGESGSMNGGR